MGKKIGILRFWAAILLGLLSFAKPNGDALAQQGFGAGLPVPIEITARSYPVAIFQDGGWVIVYEFWIFNPKHYALEINNLTISDQQEKEVYYFKGASLRAIVYRFPSLEPDTEETKENPVTLMPGEKAIIYLWLRVNSGAKIPKSLAHTFEFSRTQDDGPILLSKAGPTLSVTKNEMIIPSPVRGGQWLVGNGFSNDADHRRFLTIYDKMVIPQRFGADFLKLGRDGNNAQNGGGTLKDFYSYSEPLYAVGDGEIVRVVNKFPDDIPGQPHSIPINWESFGGNQVVLQLGPGVFALYAHLMADSIKVKIGQKVGKGTLIGLIGNSGNSTSPHLHFQMMDGQEPNGSEGIPFVFEAFCEEVRGYSFKEIEALNDDKCIPHKNSIPGNKWVVSFPE